MLSCWDREYRGLGVYKDAAEKKCSMRIVKVKEESTANMAKMADAEAKELDDRMRCKYEEWEKTGFEG
ncbi:hypothetical protein NL676_038307 [Syzygium grande]|nr:hypothetical protein NL676_038307 [Syzygium grande]